jgi:hypothetical protein
MRRYITEHSSPNRNMNVRATLKSHIVLKTDNFTMFHITIAATFLGACTVS